MLMQNKPPPHPQNNNNININDDDKKQTNPKHIKEQAMSKFDRLAKHNQRVVACLPEDTLEMPAPL